LVDWSVSNGGDGIFAVCQSSEMFFLSEQEKLDPANSTMELLNENGKHEIEAFARAQENWYRRLGL